MQVQGITVLNPQFVMAQPVQFKLKEKMFSWSGDDFKIMEATTGATWFKIKGKTFSLSDKKEFLDAQGNTIATMKESIFRIMKKMTISGHGFSFEARPSPSAQNADL